MKTTTAEPQTQPRGPASSPSLYQCIDEILETHMYYPKCWGPTSIFLSTVHFNALEIATEDCASSLNELMEGLAEMNCKLLNQFNDHLLVLRGDPRQAGYVEGYSGHYLTAAVEGTASTVLAPCAHNMMIVPDPLNADESIAAAFAELERDLCGLNVQSIEWEELNRSEFDIEVAVNHVLGLDEGAPSNFGGKDERFVMRFHYSDSKHLQPYVRTFAG